MAQITKSVDRTLVNGSENFFYTVNAAFSGLTQPAQMGEIVDFFPDEIEYTLPPIGGQIQSITQTPVPGGTEVRFQLGPVNAGTSLSYTMAAWFGAGRVDGDSFTNSAQLVADGVQVAEGTAETVFLELDENFTLNKTVQPSSVVNPGEELTFTLSLVNSDDPGATITNVQLTDILPPELIPVTSFLPVGNDVPYQGYSDPTYNGLTGTWEGNTLNFTLPSFSGYRYDVQFRATVDPSLSPGDTFNNIANWTVDGATREDATLQLTVFDPATSSITIAKQGPRIIPSGVGNTINFQVTVSNTANAPLSPYVLEDPIPAEMSLETISLEGGAGLSNYVVEIALDSAPDTYIQVAGPIASGPLPITDLTPFIPSGDRVAAIRLSAQTLNNVSSQHRFNLTGVTTDEVTEGESFINTATASSGDISASASQTVQVQNVSDLTALKYIRTDLGRTTFYPLEEFQFEVQSYAANAGIIDPIIADLIPEGLRYIENSEYFLYENQDGQIFDSREPGFPVPLPTREIIEDFAGTGRTLIRWNFDYYQPWYSYLSVVLGVFAEINPPNTFENEGYVGMPGADVLFVQNSIVDTLDIDGDGLTDDLLSRAVIQGNLLSTSEFVIDKQVKGQEDLGYSAAGLTVQGGDADYRLRITNNQLVELRDIEIVDILPYVGDTGVILVDEPRGSEFDVYATTEVTAQIVNLIGEPVDPDPDITIEYSTSNDPERFDENGDPIGTGAWSTTPPADITQLRSIRISTGPDVILNPYDQLVIDFGAKAPVGVPAGQIAYNSFAVRANRVTSTGVEPLLPTEPNKVSLTIVEDQPAALGDFVWEDLNRNGIQDPGEPGVNGVTVTLYDDMGNILATTVTANNATGDPGYYIFTDLDAGTYQVGFTAPDGRELTIQQATEQGGSRPDPATGLTGFITLAEGETRLDVDAGLVSTEVPTGELGDFVWEDLNGNGIQDPGEPGVNGVTVTLYDDAGNVLATTVTADNDMGEPGYYLFTDLEAGTYQVGFTAPDGKELTIQQATEQGGSRPDPTTGLTGFITLAEGETRLDVDAGLVDEECPPVINAQNRCIYVDDPFDPMDGVTAYACDGEDLTADIEVIENTVDITTLGLYTVTYEVTDSLGQTTQRQVYVRVIEEGPYDQAITDLIESVALQQAALAHILNAEGEKIQRAEALGLPAAEMIEVNDSVGGMIKTVTQLELMLQSKLETFECLTCGDGQCVFPEE